jgi:hypothetical protein
MRLATGNLMISRYSISVLGSPQIALSATLRAYGETAAVGVNVVNPQRLNQADREAVLDQLQTAGVRIIRAPLTAEREIGRHADRGRKGIALK